jgi:hypothetical protein
VLRYPTMNGESFGTGWPAMQSGRGSAGVRSFLAIQPLPPGQHHLRLLRRRPGGKPHGPTDSELLWDCARILLPLMGVARKVLGPAKVAFANRTRRARRRCKEIAYAKTTQDRQRGMEVTGMVKNSWVYKRVRDFRARIEGKISFLMRIFGLDRCTCRSWASLKSYAWASILSFNLLVFARHQLRRVNPWSRLRLSVFAVAAAGLRRQSLSVCPARSAAR